MKKLLTCLLLLFFTTISFTQNYQCKSFYLNYGLHLIDQEGDEALGLAYLEKADSIGLFYGEAYLKMIEIGNRYGRDTTYILSKLERFYLDKGEVATFELLSSYPAVLEILEIRKITEAARRLAIKVNQEVRFSIDFEWYNAIKNLRYVDQFHRRRKTRFTEDKDIRIKIDTTVLNQLHKLFLQNELPDKSEKLGSAANNLFIILLHNSRYCMDGTFQKVMDIVEILNQQDYWNFNTQFLLMDEHQINCGAPQRFGRGMAHWEGENLLIFPKIENIETLDSIRVSNGLLPFQFRIEKEKSRSNRRAVLPDGYRFDNDWKSNCPCELIK